MNLKYGHERTEKKFGSIYDTDIPLYEQRVAEIEDCDTYELYINNKDWNTEAQYLLITDILNLLYCFIEEAMDLAFKLKDTRINKKKIQSDDAKVEEKREENGWLCPI